MTRSRVVTQSLAAEARGMTKRHKGMCTAILVWQGEEHSLAFVHDMDSVNWDDVAAKLKGAGEELRQQVRSAVAK